MTARGADVRCVQAARTTLSPATNLAAAAQSASWRELQQVLLLHMPPLPFPSLPSPNPLPSYLSPFGLFLCLPLISNAARPSAPPSTTHATPVTRNHPGDNGRTASFSVRTSDGCSVNCAGATCTAASSACTAATAAVPPPSAAVLLPLGCCGWNSQRSLTDDNLSLRARGFEKVTSTTRSSPAATEVYSSPSRTWGWKEVGEWGAGVLEGQGV